MEKVKVVGGRGQGPRSSADLAWLPEDPKATDLTQGENGRRVCPDGGLV